MGEQQHELRHMDAYLKELIVKYWDSGIQYTIDGETRKSFRSFKSLFHIIEPYDFSSKQFMIRLGGEIQEALDNIEFKPSTEAQRIQHHKLILKIKELLGIYQSELPKAYKELNLWLQTTAKSQHVWAQLSKENFNTEKDDLDKIKKEILKHADLKTCLRNMTPDHVFLLYGRLLRENVL